MQVCALGLGNISIYRQYHEIRSCNNELLMILSQINNITCAMYHKISLRYCSGILKDCVQSVNSAIEANIFLLTDRVFVIVIIFTHDTFIG